MTHQFITPTSVWVLWLRDQTISSIDKGILVGWFISEYGCIHPILCGEGTAEEHRPNCRVFFTEEEAIEYRNELLSDSYIEAP